MNIHDTGKVPGASWTKVMSTLGMSSPSVGKTDLSIVFLAFSITRYCACKTGTFCVSHTTHPQLPSSRLKPTLGILFRDTLQGERFFLLTLPHPSNLNRIAKIFPAQPTQFDDRCISMTCGPFIGKVRHLCHDIRP